MPKTPSFSYAGRTREDMQKRAVQSGSTRQGFIKDDLKVWTPGSGDHRIRIMPPTYPVELGKHYGIDLFGHYSIGSEGSSFLCLANPPPGIEAEECPICVERERAQGAGEDELAQALRPNKRVAVWMIDRDQPNNGPQVWPMPYTMDKDIAQLAVREGTEVILLDDPDNGYDVNFTREGTNQRTRYTGVSLARRETPLSDDADEQQEWLEYIVDHPLTECVVVASAAHIAKELSGGVKMRDDKEEDGPRRGRDDDRSPRRSRDDERPRLRSRDESPRRSSRDDEERPARRPARDEERPARRRTAPIPATYEDLAAMSEEDMIELAELQEIPLDDRQDILPQLADAFGLEEPKRPVRRGNGSDDRPARRDPPARTARHEEEEEEPEPEPRPRVTRTAGGEGDRVNRLRSGVRAVRGA